MSLRLTTSRTMVSPSRRITSMPIGLGAGLPMVPKMAIEAMKKRVVCMMDLVVLRLLEDVTRVLYDCVKEKLLIVDGNVVFVIEC
jgi:hypothetical protein